jgi:periplasmic protein TonB
MLATLTYFQQNRSVLIAIAVSVLAHVALLFVHFGGPARFRPASADPGLEVILVNAKHEKPPLAADALAQANLDGGGNAEAGRTKSPLPDMHKTEVGESVTAAQAKITEPQASEQDVLTQAGTAPFKAAPVADKETPAVSPGGTDLADSSLAIARQVAEIAPEIDDHNNRLRKAYITPSTRAVGYAQYYKQFQKRVEQVGTLNFPQKEGRKIYGELVVYIPVFEDGTIYQKDGGARVEKSSGNPALDQAALNIVRRAAPFGRFPPDMLSRDQDDLWVIITRFRFTREEKMEAELPGSIN